ncbi:MAG: type I-E CRISPR-associated endoribonuclease Cas2 [Armatimonadetes bacterium]|nr:type I-E CRISPR-associated endoribonuclease Cas2 [Armatimonadota bacterium]
MVLLMLERAPAGLRGELSRWMIEPRAGVFVGRMSAMVRDKLWDMACRQSRGGAALLIYASQTEQGFTVRTHGDTSRAVVDWEGLTLIRQPRQKSRPAAPPTESAEKQNAPQVDWVPG